MSNPVTIRTLLQSGIDLLVPIYEERDFQEVASAVSRPINAMEQTALTLLRDHAASDDQDDLHLAIYMAVAALLAIHTSRGSESKPKNMPSEN